jgi:hypothetical protein
MLDLIRSCQFTTNSWDKFFMYHMDRLPFCIEFVGNKLKYLDY